MPSTSPPTVAVAHYPEGAGHATRMLAIANELRRSGAEVSMAGGGAGSRFVALNGYDEFEPALVDYIDTYQGGSLRDVLTESVPASASRVTDYVAWLREIDPDALVTDDMFAAMAAVRAGVPMYVLKHDAPGLYRDPIERAGARFHTRFQLATAREFFYPAIWPRSEIDPDGATRVPPVALDGDGNGIHAADVIVVPSHYSTLDGVAERLEGEGYDVLHVGDDDWEPTASLLPYIRGADAVVCSGYSTIMDAAVAGTPCVIHPETDEQDAVAGWIDRLDTPGFAVAGDDDAILDAVASPPAAPVHENGAAVVAGAVLDDLAERRATGAPAPERTGGAEAGAPSLRRRLADRARRTATVTSSVVLLTGVLARRITALNSFRR